MVDSIATEKNAWNGGQWKISGKTSPTRDRSTDESSSRWTFRSTHPENASMRDIILEQQRERSGQQERKALPRRRDFPASTPRTTLRNADRVAPCYPNTLLHKTPPLDRFGSCNGGRGGRATRPKKKRGNRRNPPQQKNDPQHRPSRCAHRDQQHKKEIQRHYYQMRRNGKRHNNNCNNHRGHNNSRNGGSSRGDDIKFETAKPTPNQSSHCRRRSREERRSCRLPVGNNRSSLKTFASPPLSPLSASSLSGNSSEARSLSSIPPILNFECDSVPQDLALPPFFPEGAYQFVATCIGDDLDKDDHLVTEEESSRYVALDCEMVGAGPSGERSLLARACLLDWDGRVLYDSHVLPTEPVTDYRTAVSGVREEDLAAEAGAVEMDECRDRVREMIRGKVLVGHALNNDLAVLGLSQPWYDVRDTAKYAPYMAVAQPTAAVSYGPSSEPLPNAIESDCSSLMSSSSSIFSSSATLSNSMGDSAFFPQMWEVPSELNLRPRRLRDLAATHLGIDIQVPGAEHDPIEDAKAAMGLYKLARGHWERTMAHKIMRSRNISGGDALRQ